MKSTDRAETGQQMSPGTASRGVAQVPAVPAVSLTPVKNSPITARSTAIRSSSRPRMSVTPAIVSFRIELCTGLVRLVLRNSCSIIALS